MIAVAVPGEAVAGTTQAAAFLRDRQVIVGADKLPQANGLITGSQQLFKTDPAHRALGVLAAGIGGVVPVPVARWRLGIVEHLHAIRLQLDDSRQFQGKAVRGLPGVAVPEVDVDRAITEGTGGIDQRVNGRRVLVAGR
ncbi:hypothetical protein D3C81_1727720 [compost metagenome]